MNWGGVEKVKAFFFSSLFFCLFPFLCHSPWPNHDTSVTCRSSTKLSILSLQASVSHPWSILVLPISSKEPLSAGQEEDGCRTVISLGFVSNRKIQ